MGNAFSLHRRTLLLASLAAAALPLWDAFRRMPREESAAPSAGHHESV